MERKKRQGQGSEFVGGKNIRYVNDGDVECLFNACKERGKDIRWTYDENLPVLAKRNRYGRWRERDICDNV